jgi:SAM-dependent methyltransferase
VPPPRTKQARLIEAIFRRPTLFYYLRRPLYWGSLARLREALSLLPGERLLDVGCGTGMCAPLADRGPYVGIDDTIDYVRFAASRWQNAQRSFAVMDAFACGFAPATFDKAILINMVHHLDAPSVAALFDQLRRIVRGRVVVMDAAPEIANPVERLVLRCDRGDHIRSAERLRPLFGRDFEIEREERFHNALHIVPQVIFTLRPRI